MRISLSPPPHSATSKPNCPPLFATSPYSTLSPVCASKCIPAEVSPYLAGGFGYAQYHSSELLQNGSRNPLRDRQHTYGGNGNEIRYNTPLTGLQHNGQASVGVAFTK